MGRWGLALYLGLVVGALTVASSAVGATYLVNSTDDATSPALMANCAAASGTCTLRAAIREANDTPGLDVIQVPGGTYTITLAGADEDGCETGDLDVTDDVVIYSTGPGRTIVDGNGLDRVFDVRGPSWRVLDVQLQTMRITGGSARDGGGIRTNTGLLLLSVELTGNQGQVGGGAYISVPAGAEVAINRCWITGNDAGDGTGAALWTTGEGSIYLYGTEISGNSGWSTVAHQAGSMTLDDCSVTENTTSVWDAALATNNELTLNRTSVTGNSGRGISVISQVNLGHVELSSSTVSGNGGYAFWVDDGGEVVLTGSTVAGRPAGEMPITCIYNYGGSVTARGSIIACPGAETTCTGAAGPPDSLGYNIATDDTCGLVGGTDMPGTDPRLEPLSSGFRPINALQAGSPAVDAWSEGPWPSQDGRSASRPMDGDGDGVTLADIGAYEADGAIFVDGFEDGSVLAWSSTVGEPVTP